MRFSHINPQVGAGSSSPATTSSSSTHTMRVCVMTVEGTSTLVLGDPHLPKKVVSSTTTEGSDKKTERGDSQTAKNKTGIELTSMDKALPPPSARPRSNSERRPSTVENATQGNSVPGTPKTGASGKKKRRNFHSVAASQQAEPLVKNEGEAATKNDTQQHIHETQQKRRVSVSKEGENDRIGRVVDEQPPQQLASDESCDVASTNGPDDEAAANNADQLVDAFLKSKWTLLYKNPRVENAYLEFMLTNSSALALYVILFFWLLPNIFTSFQSNVAGVTAVNMIGIVLLVICSSAWVSLTNYEKVVAPSNLANMARGKEFILCLLVFGYSMLLSRTYNILRVHCVTNFDNTPFSSSEDSSPRILREVMHSCRKSLFSYSVATAVMLLVTRFPRFIITIIVLLAAFVGQIIFRATDGFSQRHDDPWDSNDALRTCYFMVAFPVICVLRMLREVPQRRKFERSVELMLTVKAVQEEAAEGEIFVRSILPPSLVKRFMSNGLSVGVDVAKIASCAVIEFPHFVSDSQSSLPTVTASRVIKVTKKVVTAIQLCGVEQVSLRGDTFLIASNLFDEVEDHTRRILAFCVYFTYQFLPVHAIAAAASSTQLEQSASINSYFGGMSTNSFLSPSAQSSMTTPMVMLPPTGGGGVVDLQYHASFLGVPGARGSVAALPAPSHVVVGTHEPMRVVNASNGQFGAKAAPNNKINIKNLPRIVAHCGTIVGAIIGKSHIRYDVYGDAFPVARSLHSHCDAGFACVTGKFKDVLESHVKTRDQRSLSKKKNKSSDQHQNNTLGTGSRTQHGGMRKAPLPSTPWMMKPRHLVSVLLSDDHEFDRSIDAVFLRALMCPFKSALLNKTRHAESAEAIDLSATTTDGLVSDETEGYDPHDLFVVAGPSTKAPPAPSSSRGNVSTSGAMVSETASFSSVSELSRVASFSGPPPDMTTMGGGGGGGGGLGVSQRMIPELSPTATAATTGRNLELADFDPEGYDDSSSATVSELPESRSRADAVGVDTAVNASASLLSSVRAASAHRRAGGTPARSASTQPPSHGGPAQLFVTTPSSTSRSQSFRNITPSSRSVEARSRVPEDDDHSSDTTSSSAHDHGKPPHPAQKEQNSGVLAVTTAVGNTPVQNSPTIQVPTANNKEDSRTTATTTNPFLPPAAQASTVETSRAPHDDTTTNSSQFSSVAASPTAKTMPSFMGSREKSGAHVRRESTGRGGGVGGNDTSLLHNLPHVGSNLLMNSGVPQQPDTDTVGPNSNDNAGTDINNILGLLGQMVEESSTSHQGAEVHPMGGSSPRHLRGGGGGASANVFTSSSVNSTPHGTRRVPLSRVGFRPGPSVQTLTNSTAFAHTNTTVQRPGGLSRGSEAPSFLPGPSVKASQNAPSSPVQPSAGQGPHQRPAEHPQQQQQDESFGRYPKFSASGTVRSAGKTSGTTYVKMTMKTRTGTLLPTSSAASPLDRNDDLSAEAEATLPSAAQATTNREDPQRSPRHRAGPAPAAFPGAATELVVTSKAISASRGRAKRGLQTPAALLPGQCAAESSNVETEIAKKYALLSSPPCSTSPAMSWMFGALFKRFQDPTIEAEFAVQRILWDGMHLRTIMVAKSLYVLVLLMIALPDAETIPPIAMTLLGLVLLILFCGVVLTAGNPPPTRETVLTFATTMRVIVLSVSLLLVSTVPHLGHSILAHDAGCAVILIPFFCSYSTIPMRFQPLHQYSLFVTFMVNTHLAGQPYTTGTLIFAFLVLCIQPMIESQRERMQRADFADIACREEVLMTLESQHRFRESILRASMPAPCVDLVMKGSQTIHLLPDTIVLLVQCPQIVLRHGSSHPLVAADISTISHGSRGRSPSRRPVNTGGSDDESHGRGSVTPVPGTSALTLNPSPGITDITHVPHLHPRRGSSSVDSSSRSRKRSLSSTSSERLFSRDPSRGGTGTTTTTATTPSSMGGMLAIKTTEQEEVGYGDGEEEDDGLPQLPTPTGQHGGGGGGGGGTLGFHRHQSSRSEHNSSNSTPRQTTSISSPRSARAQTVDQSTRRLDTAMVADDVEMVSFTPDIAPQTGLSLPNRNDDAPPKASGLPPQNRNRPHLSTAETPPPNSGGGGGGSPRRRYSANHHHNQPSSPISPSSGDRWTQQPLPTAETLQQLSAIRLNELLEESRGNVEEIIAELADELHMIELLGDTIMIAGPLMDRTSQQDRDVGTKAATKEVLHITHRLLTASAAKATTMGTNDEAALSFGASSGLTSGVGTDCMMLNGSADNNTNHHTSSTGNISSDGIHPASEGGGSHHTLSTSSGGAAGTMSSNHNGLSSSDKAGEVRNNNSSSQSPSTTGFVTKPPPPTSPHSNSSGSPQHRERSPFTVVISQGFTTTVLAFGESFPVFYLLGPAVNQARGLLSAAPGGSCLTTEHFMRSVRNYSNDEVRGSPVTPSATASEHRGLKGDDARDGAPQLRGVGPDAHSTPSMEEQYGLKANKAAPWRLGGLGLVRVHSVEVKNM